jgi:hypothetical protein
MSTIAHSSATVEVVDAVPPAAFGQDETGFGKHGQMLHDREPAELREPGGQFTGRGGRGPEPVEQAPAPPAGQARQTSGPASPATAGFPDDM